MSLSYGFIPAFVKTPILDDWFFIKSPIYEDLVSENPKLEPTIRDQLLERELYYKSKNYEIVFEKIKNGKVKLKVKTKTWIRNSTTTPKPYKHVAIFANDGTEYSGVTIVDHTGKTEYYSVQKIKGFDRSEIEGGYKYTFKDEVIIPPKESVEIDSVYSLNRPVGFNELPLVTNRLVNSNVTYTILDKTGDDKFTYAFNSLAFPEELEFKRSDDGKEMTITIPGPLFTAQGISLIWELK